MVVANTPITAAPLERQRSSMGRLRGAGIGLAATASLQSPPAAGGGPRRAVPARLSARATMKAILFAALVLGLCGPARAGDAKAGPVGTWKCAYDIGGQKPESTLVVKKD